MQKKLLAVVVASMVAGQAMAVTIVDDGTTKAEIGGYLDLRYIDQDVNESTKGSDSRVNFAFEHKMTEATTVFSKFEWGFNALNNNDFDGDGFFNNRLGYVGAKNEQLGSVSFGKQWSSYGMVAGYTDVFAATGGSASGYYGADGDILGTARADDALQYNFSMNGLNISAQTQLGDHRSDTATIGQDSLTVERSSSYGIAASYDLPMGLSFGAAFNTAKVNGDGTVAGLVIDGEYDAQSTVLGVKFEADKIYAAFTYADLENRIDSDMGLIAEGTGYELYASYQLNEMFKVEGGYNQLEGENADGSDMSSEIKYMPVAVVYTQGPVQLSGTYQFEKSKIANVDDEDKIIMQARYYF